MQDDLTTTLLHQCRESQFTVQTIIETAGDNAAVLFEALNINDEIQKVISKYKDMKRPMVVVPPEPEPAMIPVAVQPENVAKEEAPVRKQDDAQTAIHGENNDKDMDDLDEMIFGKTSGSTSEAAHGTKKKDDLIHFQ